MYEYAGNPAIGRTVYYEGNVALYPPGVVPQFHARCAYGLPSSKCEGRTRSLIDGAAAAADEEVSVGIGRTMPLHCFSASLSLASQSHFRAHESPPVFANAATGGYRALNSTPSQTSKQRETGGSTSSATSDATATVASSRAAMEAITQVTPFAPLPPAALSLYSQRPTQPLNGHDATSLPPYSCHTNLDLMS